MELKLSAEQLSDSMLYCNFFKSDITSKETNGCLLQTTAGNVVVVGTDSSIGAMHLSDLENKIDLDFRTILSSAVFKLLKNFVLGSEDFNISLYHSSLIVKTENRAMLVPALKDEYLIDDPESFFSVSGELVAKLNLSAFVSLVSTLINYSSDFHKKITLSLVPKEGISVETDKNSSKNIPAEVSGKASIVANGSMLLTITQKLSNFTETGHLYYNKENRRLTLTSEDGRLVYLMLGLKN
jgi:hypothetical protein